MYFQRIMDGKEMGYDNGRKIDKVKPAVPKEGGSPELIVMQSPKYLKCNDSIYVFTPENAQPHATIILLHGWQGDYKAWSDRVDIQAVCNETGFRIICPDGFYNGWYMNNSDKNKMQAKDFFNKEFFPQIFAKYNLNPQTTFIDGLSMGGHGAVTLFIDNKKLFRAAGSMSGVLDLNDCYNHYAEPEKLSTGLSQDMKKIVGDDLSRFSKESAISRVNRVKRNNKFIIVSCGYNDYMSKEAEKFCTAAWNAQVRCIETLSPGYHSWRFWEYALYQHIWYFQRIIDDKGMGTKK
jgi:Predicted esterase